MEGQRSHYYINPVVVVIRVRCIVLVRGIICCFVLQSQAVSGKVQGLSPLSPMTGAYNVVTGRGILCVVSSIVSFFFSVLERYSASEVYGRCSVARLRDGRSWKREKEPRERGRGGLG